MSPSSVPSGAPQQASIAASAARSPRLHAGLADDRSRLRGGEEFQQRAGGLGWAGGLVYPGGEHRDVLDVLRQRPEIVDALDR